MSLPQFPVRKPCSSTRRRVGSRCPRPRKLSTAAPPPCPPPPPSPPSPPPPTLPPPPPPPPPPRPPPPPMPTFSTVTMPPGDPIRLGADGRLEDPDRPVIPFIEGDGTGPDIWRASQA